jgi:hypothetical protein
MFTDLVSSLRIYRIYLASVFFYIAKPLILPRNSFGDFMTLCVIDGTSMSLLSIFLVAFLYNSVVLGKWRIVPQTD